MEHAKKLILISQEALQRIKQNTSDEPTKHLDDDMKKIINSNLPDFEKWALYKEVLQRYLHFQKVSREPIKLPIQEENKLVLKDEQSSPLAVKKEIKSEKDIKNIISGFPQSYQRKAFNLLQKIKSDESITWNNDGVVAINNKEIPNSNITDLIGDSLRYLKYSSPPIGWKEFYSELHNKNTPIALIGNPKRRKLNKDSLPDRDLNLSVDYNDSKISHTPKNSASWDTFKF